MRANPSLIVAASVLLSCLMLCLTFGRSAVGQPAVSPPPGGRFQVVVTSSQGNDRIYVFEPGTGQGWYRTPAAGDAWIDLGSPAIKRGK